MKELVLMRRGQKCPAGLDFDHYRSFGDFKANGKPWQVNVLIYHQKALKKDETKALALNGHVAKLEAVPFPADFSHKPKEAFCTPTFGAVVSTLNRMFRTEVATNIKLVDVFE